MLSLLRTAVTRPFSSSRSTARVTGEVLTPICSASLEMFSLLPGGMAEEKMAFSSSS